MPGHRTITVVCPTVPDMLACMMQEHCAMTALLARGQDAAPALVEPGRAALTYDALRQLIATTRTDLHGCGIGRGMRIALQLPNGPVMAAAFLVASATGTAAPLNPALRREECDFYLADTRAAALMAEAGADGPAVAAAEALGIPVLRVHADSATAGGFHVEGPTGAAPSDGAPAILDDVALLLHTSGTTARPKLVPLTHANLQASARHIATTLELTSADRCLNVMPLFHIHGLVACLAAPLAVGGSVAVSPGFDAFAFFRWLTDAAPSWYSAVPTMHQAVLARAARNRAAISTSSLRVIRSSSASLPPTVMAELEATFGVPVIESYGMTEAAHQMASNPLPPAGRKPGSVGPAAGPEVAIMDPGGKLLGHESVGEVVIRGPNVTAGYLERPEANAEAYTDGWFRTGDLGRLDRDGYLFLAGRIKEIVNRGGEKISPREVDEALLAHPDVVQAVAFAVPHARLGEDLAAAVVAAEGAAPAPEELRRFVAERVAAFKVPRRVLVVDEIPKGPTGKLQRIGLAKQLGLAP